MRNFVIIAVAGVLIVAGCQDHSSPTATVDGLAPQLTSHASHHSGHRFVEFEHLVGVPRPFTGPANAIRGVSGGGLPWVLEKGEAKLDDDGTLRIDVEGLVIDPNDPTAIALSRAGTNPSETFGGLLSCLTRDADDNAVIVNLETGRFPATTGAGAGDAKIEETLDGIPDPCIAPIVFITSAVGHWFAASGFPSSGVGGSSFFDFEALVGVPRPFTGSANAIRGVSGGGLPWVVDKGEAKLDEDGTLAIDVEGLVIDPNDPTAIALSRAGTNPSETFGGLLSCLTRDADGNAVTVNLETARFPATTGAGAGDSKIEEMLAGISNPCIAPIVFVTSRVGSWFAATGF